MYARSLGTMTFKAVSKSHLLWNKFCENPYVYGKNQNFQLLKQWTVINLIQRAFKL